MKKILIIIAILLSGIYITSAIGGLKLQKGKKVGHTIWKEINNVTKKINFSNNDLNLNGNLISSGKICVGNSCLGVCEEGYIWDSDSLTCLLKGTAPNTSDEGSTCKTLLADNSDLLNQDGYYYIWPNGLSKEIKAWCDMTTNGGGRTRWFKHDSIYANLSYAGNCINDGYYENSDFFCIKPDLFGNPIDKPTTGNHKVYPIEGVEYMAIKGTQKIFPLGNTVGENYNRESDGKVMGRGLGNPSTSCREYKRDGYGGKNRRRYNGTQGTYIVDCYIR